MDQDFLFNILYSQNVAHTFSTIFTEKKVYIFCHVLLLVVHC